MTTCCKFRTLLLGGPTVLGISIAAAGSVHALTLTLNDLGTPGSEINVVDGGSMDNNPAAGAITYIGGIGEGWAPSSVVSLFSKPAIGDPDRIAKLDLSAAVVDVGGGNSLYAAGRDDGYEPFGQRAPFRLDAGGVTQGRASFDASVEQEGSVLEQLEVGPFAGAFLRPMAFSGSDADQVNFNDGLPFGTMISALIEHSQDGAPAITTFNAEASVIPLPAALPMFGAALALLGWVGHRRKSA